MAREERDLGGLETADSVALSRDLAAEERPSFEDYEIVDEIGRGSFGTVYRCRSRGDDRRLVAIKVPRPDGAAIALFEQELDLLLRLPNHRHVVQVIRSTRALLSAGRSLPAVVMAWIPNARAIDEYCDHHRLGRRARLTLLARTADGLQHLHEHGVVHLDLKPRNVLVADDGTPVIVDLGAARQRLAHADAPSVMTIAYASPEQLAQLDPETIDQRSDLYSLGRLMGAVLLGHDVNAIPPHGSRAEAIRRMADWTSASYREHPRWPGGELGSLLESMLVRDRAQRSIRAHEVATTLHRLAQPTLMRLHATGTRVMRMRSVRGAVAFGLACALGFTAAVGLCWAYAAAGIGPPLAYPPRDLTSIRDVVVVSLDPADAVGRADRRSLPASDDLERALRRRFLIADILRASHAAGASVTVVDMMLPANGMLREGTDAIAAALRETRSTMPTVMGIKGRWTHDVTPDVLEPTLEPLVHGLGSFDITLTDGAGVVVPIAVLRGDHRPAMHLASAAVAAHLRATLSVDPGFAPILQPEARFASAWGSRSVRSGLDGLRRLSETEAKAPPSERPLSQGADAGDAAAIVRLASEDIVRLGPAISVPVDVFLAMSDAERRERVGTRIVLIWNGEPVASVRDVHPLGPSGETSPGGWVQAAAMQALLDGQREGISDRTLLAVALALTATGALSGAALRRAIARRRSPFAIALIAAPLAVALLGCGVWLAGADSLLDFRPLFLLLASAMAAGAAAMIDLLRAVLPDPAFPSSTLPGP